MKDLVLMKKTALATALLTGLLMTVFTVQFIEVAEAPPPLSSGIKIISPANATYSSSSLTLNVSMTGLVASNINRTLTYSLDGEAPIAVPLEIDCGEHVPSIIATISGLATLSGLVEGPHNITVNMKTEVTGKSPLWDNGTACFLIDDGVPPMVSVLSVENKTYATSDIPLTYSINEQVVRVLYYLDGQVSVYLSGNTTLTDLSEGSHDIIVHAYDGAGNEVSEKVYFTVSPLPVALISVLIAVIAIVGVGLIIYFKKRKH